MEEIKKVRKKKYTYFIGIDVSKNELDFAVMHQNVFLFHQECKNERESVIAFIARLKEIPGFRLSKAIFCMENTGFYGNILLQVLKKLKVDAAVEHPLHLKRSLGLVREKSDKSDAIKIAAYAEKNVDRLKLWSEKRSVITTLNHLFTLRTRLLTTSFILSKPIKEQELFIQKKLHFELGQLCKESINALKADISDVEIRMKALIASDERLKRLHYLIMSIAGIGFFTSTLILISTNEFLGINDPKKFAAYAGVAPFRRESGKNFRRARTSKEANAKMKSLLHMSALNAIRHDQELKHYYQRKTIVEGKAKMVVINAIRSKLILRVFACVSQDRPYTKDYLHQKTTAEGAIELYESLEA